jgi:hypothetical protein
MVRDIETRVITMIQNPQTKMTHIYEKWPWGERVLPIEVPIQRK